MAASQVPWQERTYAFRKLLVDLSNMLTESEAKQIEYLRGLPQASTGKREGLDVLMELEKRGAFSPTKTEPLIELLQEIDRHDIANSVRDYQAAYPDTYTDNSHRQISRATSKSVPLPASPNVGQLRRSQTCEYNIPDITVSLPEVQSYPQLPHMQGANDSLLSPPASFSSVSLDGCCIPPQQMEPEITHAGLCMSNGILPSPPPNTDKAESELASRENRSRANTGPSQSSRSVEDSYTSARHSSWSVGTHGRNTQCTYHITQNIYMTPTSSPAISRSGSEEAIPVETDNVRSHPPLAATSRNQTYPNKECTSLNPGTRQHPGLSQSRSAPSKICQEKQGKSTNSAPSDEGDGESEGETMMRPRSRVLSCRDKPKTLGANKHRNKFSRKFSWTGKGDDEWSTQYTWSIQRQSLQQPIWNHHHLSYTQCSECIPINIKCGEHNPYLTLRLYPNGLFEDKNIHMTLLMKVTLPNLCPPLPTTASFSLSWEICMVRLKDAEKSEGAEKLRSSKKLLKIPFDKGVVYIQKLLSHTALLQNQCEELQLRLSLSTSYSPDDVDVCGDISSSTEGDGVGKTEDSVIEPTYTERRPTMNLLSCFKTADGNLNIPQEIGEHYMQFGCLLLNDTSGAVTKNIASRGDAARVNHEILCQWLQGRGKMPVQWLTLIKTLKDIEMNVLASDIEAHLRLNVMTDQS